ncbi:hypothetical protein Tco_0889998 [Tanacetum coccineum]
MADLTFADSHNMVAYMEKSEDNADFAKIVDFLNASPIRYALTSNEPTNLDADEAVYEERGDSVEKAATTATSLDAEQGSGNINRTQSMAIPNAPFPQGIGSGGSPRRQDTMGARPTQTRFKRVLDLENVKDAQALEIKKLKKRVKKLEKKSKGKKEYHRRLQRTRLARGVIMKEASETATRPTVPPPQIDPKDKGKAKMRLQAELDEEARLEREREEEASKAANIAEWDDVQAMMDTDYELAAKLQASEQGEISIEERSKLFMELMNERKKHFAKLRVEEQIRKSLTKAQKRNQMSNYLKNMVGYTLQQLRGYSFDEIKTLFETTMRNVNTFVPIESEVDRAISKLAAGSSKMAAEEELDQESSKRQKTGESSELAEEPRDKEADELS